MLPVLPAGRLVLATSWMGELKVGQLVIVWHGGLEKIKRLEAVRGDQIFVVGDNPRASVDSRQFGWLPRASIRARIIWPRV